MSEASVVLSDREMRGIMDGNVTAIRRVVNLKKQFDSVQPASAAVSAFYRDPAGWEWVGPPDGKGLGRLYQYSVRCPFGVPGDKLSVQTEYMRCVSADGHCVSIWDEFTGRHRFSTGGPDIFASREMLGAEWKSMPAITMPHWACRPRLQIAAVCAERVQDISENDASAEGIEYLAGRYTFNGGLHQERSARMSLAACWNSVHRKDGFDWDANPWTWIIRFAVLKPE